MIKDLLIGKPAKEQANIKGQEIAKIKSVPRVNVKFSGADYDIEIVSFNATEKGIEIFARAWDSNGQVGFGKDGSVDIERFVMPIYGGGVNGHLTYLVVEDPLGDISVDYTVYDHDLKTDVIKTFKFREDPKEVILRTLAHTIGLIDNKPRGKIVSGKIGNTTLTAYPNAGTANPMDNNPNRTVNDTVGEAFTVINGGAGTGIGNPVSTVETGWNLRTLADTDTDKFAIIKRGMWGWDTSSIGTDQVDSAIASFYVVGKGIAQGDTDAEIVDASPANEGALAAGDYVNVGSTRLATAKTISALTTSAYNDWTLNATGLSNINKTGNTYMAGRTKWELDNSFGGVWASDNETYVDVRFADFADVTSDPKLVVEHSAAAAAANHWLLMGV